MTRTLLGLITVSLGSLMMIACGSKSALTTRGQTGSGGATSSGGATGSVMGGGGLTSASGGAVGTGGTLAAAGVTGTGEASGLGGSLSTSDLDTCASDDDCTTSCTWTTAPTDSSQCFAEYCCGSNWMSKRRCEANQAAWAIYCPNQSSTFIDCPCITMCDTPAQTITLGCVGGKCEFVCSPPALGAGGSTALPQASGGYTGNDGAGGHAGTGGSSNSGGSGGSGIGGSLASGGAPAAGGAIGAGGVVETGGMMVTGGTVQSGGVGAGGIVGTGGEIGTGGAVPSGDAGVACAQIANATACDAQVDCYALFSGTLPCNSTACSNHFVSCAQAPPECAPATNPCTIDCPLTGSFCPRGYVSVFSNSSGCCFSGCVIANKCS